MGVSKLFFVCGGYFTQTSFNFMSILTFYVCSFREVDIERSIDNHFFNTF